MDPNEWFAVAFVACIGYVVNGGFWSVAHDGDLLVWAGVPGRLFFVVSLLIPFGAVVSVGVLAAIRFVVEGG